MAPPVNRRARQLNDDVSLVVESDVAARLRSLALPLRLGLIQVVIDPEHGRVPRRGVERPRVDKGPRARGGGFSHRDLLGDHVVSITGARELSRAYFRPPQAPEPGS